MKKRISVAMTAVMLAGVLTACGTSGTTPTTEAATTEATTEAVTTEEATTEAPAETEKETETEKAEESGYRMGMAVVSSMAKSKEAGEKDGSAQVDSVAAAIVLDEDGVIVDCVIDTVQTIMAFDAEGKLVTPLDTEFDSKKVLKDEYGMKPASSIGKEWYEQMAVFEEYVIGKTVDEVTGIVVDEKTVPTDEDLLAGVTIKIGDYIEAISQAAEDAKVIGTQPGDKLGLGIVGKMSKSKDAEEGKEGQGQAYSTYVAVTTDADGKITACIIDSTQGTVKFDAEGKITSDLTVGVKTKRQLGDDYGMKPASGIGKEWFEQAAALEEYVIGKTAAEVSGIAVAEGVPTDADLAASVTIGIGDYQAGIEKAVASANE